MIGAVLAGIAVGVAFLALRIAPMWPLRNRGCDAYYFLLTAEAWREGRRIPIRLPPYYILESEEQDYPPLFSIMLGLLPARVVERRYWAINHVVDLLSLGALMAFVASESGLSWAIGAGLIYGATPLLVHEYATLTSRSLGHVTFLGTMFASWWWVETGEPLALAAAAVAGVFLLYAHKLSVQLLWFLLPFLAATELDVRWLLPLPLGYAISVGIAPRTFVAMQRMHGEIVSFWGRNWPFLSAHQVENSPVYGDGKPHTGYHRGTGVRRLVHYLVTVAQHQPWSLPAVVGAGVAWPLHGVERFVFLWLVGTYLWALLTLVVPALRCLGEGTKYLKYAAVPAIFLSVRFLAEGAAPVVWAAAALAGSATIVGYVLVVRRLNAPDQRTGVQTDDLDTLLELVRVFDGARVMCIPTQIADLTAYRTQKPVLWGTHHAGFPEVEPFYPVLRKPVEWFVERYHLTHLLLDTEYAALETLRPRNVTEVARRGRYLLVEFSDAGETSDSQNSMRLSTG